MIVELAASPCGYVCVVLFAQIQELSHKCVCGVVKGEKNLSDVTVVTARVELLQRVVDEMAKIPGVQSLIVA
jgi:hypothetical protein